MELYYVNFTTEIVVAIIVVFFSAIYLYVRFVLLNYWQWRGVNTLQPTVPFGDFGPTLLQTISFGDLSQNFYYAARTDKLTGVYAVFKPMLLIRDPEMVRNVFHKDFAYFSDRNSGVDPDFEPVMHNILTMRSEEWTPLRTMLTPLFTPGKLKAMFSTFLTSANVLQTFADKAAVHSETHEMREIAARYTTDVIASIAFGLDINTIENPEMSFRRFGRKVQLLYGAFISSFDVYLLHRCLNNH